MSSPPGPLMANAFMCNIEEQLTNQNKMPAFYKRYVDDTLSKMPDVSSASEFLSTLSEITLKLLYVKLALFRPLTLIVLLSSGTISVNYHPLPVFQLLLPSATLLLSTCFTFCKITLTYSIPVPGQLYDPAPAIPSFFSVFWLFVF